MKKLLLVVFCILLLVPLAFAQPPSFQTFTQELSGLEIEVPVGDFVIQNQDIKTNVHVYNSSDGIIMRNDTVSCILHIFNITGYHLASEAMEFDEDKNDFFVVINGTGNFSEVGFRAFLINCNTSTYGGFIGGNVRVTPDGESDAKSDTSPGISATIFLLFITTLLFAFPIFKQDFLKHNWANKIIKRAFWTVGIFVLMWNASILSTIADNANLDIVSHFLRYMIIFGWAGYLSLFYLVLKSLFEMIETWKINRSQKRFGKEDKKDGF